MSLKHRLATLTTADRTHEVEAPELGPGGKCHVKRFTIGERLAFAALFEGLRELKPNGTFATPYDEQLKRLLPHVAVEPDGTPTFTGPDDPALDLMPTTLAERLVLAATQASTVGGGEAKKPSPATRNSSS